MRNAIFCLKTRKNRFVSNHFMFHMWYNCSNYTIIRELASKCLFVLALLIL